MRSVAATIMMNILNMWPKILLATYKENYTVHWNTISSVLFKILLVTLMFRVLNLTVTWYIFNLLLHFHV